MGVIEETCDALWVTDRLVRLIIIQVMKKF